MPKLNIQCAKEILIQIGREVAKDIFPEIKYEDPPIHIIKVEEFQHWKTLAGNQIRGVFAFAAGIYIPANFSTRAFFHELYHHIEYLKANKDPTNLVTFDEINAIRYSDKIDRKYKRKTMLKIQKCYSD